MTRLYRTVGLEGSTWNLLDEARKNPAFLETYGRVGTESDAIEWLIRQGTIRIRTDPLFNALEVER